MDVSWEVKHFPDCTPDDVFEFAKLRTDVFFLEQACNEEELDHFDRDPRTVHVFARASGQLVGYARVVYRDVGEEEDRGVTVSIGRVVVAATHRGQGIAQGLMARSLKVVGDQDVIVHAQTYVASLYAHSGFVQFGEPFEEAGIPHVRMIRTASR